MSDGDVACPCCGHRAPIGAFVDPPHTGCSECEATLAEQKEAAKELAEA